MLTFPSWTSHISEHTECSFLFPTLLDNRNKFLAVKTHLVDHYLSSYFLFNFSHFNLKSVWLIMMSQGSHGFMTTHKWRDSVGASINVEASGTAGPGRI